MGIFPPTSPYFLFTPRTHVHSVLLTCSFLIAPNALSDLKARFKSLLKGGKSKKAENKPVEATKTEEPAATTTEAAPAEPAARE
jgi:hypothetical protein